MALTAAEDRFWRDYLAQLPPDQVPRAPVVTAGHAGGPESADQLAQLYLDGRKTAGSSILEDFLAAGDLVPQVGDYWIVLAGDGEPRCILRTVTVETRRFADVPVEIAVAEGEGDLSIDHWRQVHAELYAPHLEAWGVSGIDEATVVTEFFELVHRCSGRQSSHSVADQSG